MLIVDLLQKSPSNLCDKINKCLTDTLNEILSQELWDACQDDNIDLLKELIEIGVDITHLDEDEYVIPVLKFAYENDNLDMLKLYLKEGGQIKDKDIIEAAEKASINTIKYLLESDAFKKNQLNALEQEGVLEESIKKAVLAENMDVAFYLIEILKNKFVSS